MPRGPKGEKRPADAIGNAIMVAKLATGEPTETTKAAAMLGKQGGKARAASLTARQRSEIAKLAAEARWRKGGS
jgi:hypothetical protein